MIALLALAVLSSSSVPTGWALQTQPSGARDASGFWWSYPLDHPYRRSATTEVLDAMPQVGDTLDLGSLRDATGGNVSAGSLAGERGTIVVAIQSLDWSPFCLWQVAMWNERLDDAQAAGYGVVVISGTASEDRDVTKLVDAEDELGLRSPLIESGEEGFGSLLPVTFVVDRDGRIEHRFVHKHHARRATPGTVLAALGVVDVPPAAVTQEGQGLRASAALLDPALWLEGESTLAIRLELDPGRYIYTDPLPDGFIATTVQVLPTDGLRFSRIAYPPSESKEFPDLGVTLPIYQGVADFLVPIRATSGQLGFDVESPTNGYPIFVRVDYQTCSASFCFSPQTLELYLEASATTFEP